MKQRHRRSDGVPQTAAWLTVQQVADHLQVSRVTVWRWLRSGRLSGVRVGRVRRIALSALGEFAAQEWRKPAAGAARPRVLGTEFTLSHPLWDLVGKGRGTGANVSGNKYKYLAHAIDRR